RTKSGTTPARRSVGRPRNLMVSLSSPNWWARRPTSFVASAASVRRGRRYPCRVAYFAVRLERGGPWDWSRGLREQAGWDEHARFMDGLVDDGFVVLGGPLEGDRDVLLIIDAESEAAIRARMAEDPWWQS